MEKTWKINKYSRWDGGMWVVTQSSLQIIHMNHLLIIAGGDTALESLNLVQDLLEGFVKNNVMVLLEEKNKVKRKIRVNFPNDTETCRNFVANMQKFFSIQIKDEVTEVNLDYLKWRQLCSDTKPWLGLPTPVTQNNFDEMMQVCMLDPYFPDLT